MSHEVFPRKWLCRDSGPFGAGNSGDLRGKHTDVTQDIIRLYDQTYPVSASAGGAATQRLRRQGRLRSPLRRSSKPASRPDTGQFRDADSKNLPGVDGRFFFLGAKGCVSIKLCGDMRLRPVPDRIDAVAFSALGTYTGLHPKRSRGRVGASPLFCWARKSPWAGVSTEAAA